MAEPLVVSVERSWPTAIAAVSGLLRRTGVGALHSAMRKCLADCPDALVIDLARMTCDSDLVLLVFATMQKDAAVWPAIPVALCGPSADVAKRLQRLGLSRRVQVCPDRAAAIAAVHGPPTTARTDHELARTAGAPAEARALIGDVCATWGLDGLAEPARLVASELVTNAVVPARGGIRLTVLVRRPYLHLIVRDHSPEPPRWPPAAPERTALSPGGRGLHLVGQVSAASGHLSDAGGKAVWARLRIPDSD